MAVLSAFHRRKSGTPANSENIRAPGRRVWVVCLPGFSVRSSGDWASWNPAPLLRRSGRMLRRSWVGLPGKALQWRRDGPEELNPGLTVQARPFKADPHDAAWYCALLPRDGDHNRDVLTWE